MLKLKYACAFLSIFIVLGCLVNTEEGKCKRDIKIEKIDQGDPCILAILSSPAANNEKTKSFFQFQMALCMWQEQKKYACGKKSNILPVLQEPRGDIN